MKILRIPILGILIMLYAWPLTVYPEVAAAASHERTETRYIVRQGDTLSKIARQFYEDDTKWELIFNANKAVIKTPSALQVGWSLRIPNLDDTRSAMPQPSPRAQPEPAPSVTPARQQPSTDKRPAATNQRPATPATDSISKRTIVTRNLYAPFVLQSLQNKGMLTEIIRTAFEAINYDVDFHFRSLDEGLSAAREGRVTGVFPLANEPSLRAKFFASQPLYRVLIRAFVRTESPISFDSLDDLKGLVLCQPKGTSTAELQPLITSDLVKINRPSSINTCFKALLDNQVDMVVVNEFGGRNALHNMGFGKQVCVLDKAIAIETMHLLFSKIAPQSRVVLYEFDQALRRLEKNGKLKSITTRHLQSYYQTLPLALQECSVSPPPEEQKLAQDVATPSSTSPPSLDNQNKVAQNVTAPPPQTQRDTAEGNTPKPMKPAADSSFAPVRPVMPQQLTDDLARIAPLAPPHRQAEEFLDFVAPQRPPKQLELVSLAMTNRPKIDGYAEDAIWQLAPAVTTLDAASQRQITLKSVHTADEIFFLVSFPDQAASETHLSWGWDDTAEAYKPMGDREDAFVFKWSMVGNQVNLAFQNAEPHRADVWHWKAFRTDHAGYADDRMHLLLPEPHQEATLVASPIHGDLFLRQLADAGQGAYREQRVQDYKADYLPRFYLNEPEGSRADVRAKGAWHDQTWTLEFGRKMQTGNADDLKFEPGEFYLFAVSCYDMAHGKLEASLTQPLDKSGDAFDRLILKIERAKEG